MAARQVGRPTVMTPDTKDLILEAIESGMSNRRACETLGVDFQTFYLALSRDPEFSERYQAAKAACADVHVDEAEEAAHEARRAESGHQVAGVKVFVDLKKWQAARLAPQRWGEKASVHITGQIAADDQEMAKRIAFLEALQAQENEEGPEDPLEP